MNLVAFCPNALRYDADQTILAAWQLADVTVVTLNSRLNGLDFRTDLLRSDLDEPQTITAPKHFAVLGCDHFSTSAPGVRLQGVDVADWVARSVLAGGTNYTIQGTTELTNATVFGDVRVFGLVNGQPFSADGILLTSGDQQLEGNVEISNSGPEQIRPLSINEATFDFVNGVPVNEFLANIVRIDDQPASVRINSPVHFERAPVVQSMHTTGEWNGRSVPTLVGDLRSAVAAANHNDRLAQLRSVGAQLVAHLESEL